jgi:serine protease Do
MTRRFTAVTLGLTATVAFLVGLIVAGSLVPTPALSSGTRPEPAISSVRRPSTAPAAGSLVNFADVAERINPAVVNIDATSREAGERQSVAPSGRDLFDDPLEFGNPPGQRDVPRRGAGSGFIIDRAGYILTNNHVVEGADRITVKLSDGRSLRAQVAGTDPDTDIALLKVESTSALPVAPLGDSATLRVGEWVCAIGNPLAYEHTVTVGVVSFIGRKLFDNSLDQYIQTDAAINFGNSGGPLINSEGEVIGINAAISSRASSIGFAVPINQANAILPQLKAAGRVSRGYIGVALKDVDPDLQASLKLTASKGALVQDVTPGSPGERAGLQAYDLIVSVDDQLMESNDQLIQEISARQPGSIARLTVIRNGREQQVSVKLAERPGREGRGDAEPGDRSTRPEPQNEGPAATTPRLGLVVRELDRDTARRLGVPRDLGGVVVSKVEAMSGAFDAGIERGWVVLEINRHPVTSAPEFRRLVENARAGDVLAFYLYVPDLEQRTLRTIRVEEP